MNTVKNCYSPAGMCYSTHGTGFVHELDCPKCKYGTLRLTKEGWHCIDCHANYTPEALAQLGVKLPKPR